MAKDMKKKGGRVRITTVLGLAGLLLSAGVAMLAYGKYTGTSLPPFLASFGSQIDSRFGVLPLGKASLVPPSLVLLLFSLGFFALRRRHPFSLVLYPVLFAIYLTANFIAGMTMKPSQAWPGFLYDKLQEGCSNALFCYLIVALILAALILVAMLLGLLAAPLNVRYVRRKDFLRRKEEHDALQNPPQEEAPPLSAKEARREAKLAKRAAKLAAKEAKRKANEQTHAASPEPVQEAENQVTVTVPLQQDDGHLRFPKAMEVPAIDNLLKRSETAERPAAPAKGTWSTPQTQTPQPSPSGPSVLDLVKEKVQQECPIASPQRASQAPAPVQPAPADTSKAQVSGLLQGAMERVGWHGRKKAAAQKTAPAPAKGLLAEAVEENLRKNKEIAGMGSSFSKMVPDKESEIMRPVEEQEAALKSKTIPMAAKKEEEVASVIAPQPTKVVAPPTPEPKPVPKPQLLRSPDPASAPKEEKDEDMLDDLQSICGVGGLASANAGKSALLNREKLDYHLPPVDLLVDYPAASQEVDELTRQKGDRLVQTLDEFGISVTPVSIIKGPTVTMYEIAPAPGVRVNKILGLSDNIQLSLPATQVRIVAPIPGKSCVGVEVPNATRATVGFKEMLPALDLKDYKLPMILGRNLFGEPICCDVAKTPHLLIAGATGSGKSVCVNSLICSILYKKTPREVRMVMVDPKVVELQMYNGIPHLLTPVITDSKKTLKVLDFCLDEMDRRYRLLESLRTRNIEGYNAKIAQGGIAREKMPYILIVIDEFADLMNTVGKELEQKISRMAAMSRAVGIHLVLATQRPSVDVVTGIIKSNLPGRIAFMVNSATDSRIILDQTGAEKLLGKGDMLYQNPSAPNPQRIQGAFLSDTECEKIVDFVSAQAEPDYIDEAFLEDEPDRDANIDGFDEDSQDGADEADLYQQALSIVVERKSASASFLQRRLRIGYNHAARLVEQMEDEGIVGPANGSKPRPLLRYPGSPSLQQLDAGAAPTADDIGG